MPEYEVWKLDNGNFELRPAGGRAERGEALVRTVTADDDDRAVAWFDQILDADDDSAERERRFRTAGAP